MGTAYPGSDGTGRDTFNVPSLPEETPTSQAGPGNTRNITESIRDQGDAIEALENYASQRGHDHSGDASDPRKGIKLAEVNTHQSSDVDTATSAKHHTLGTGANQAAAGNHNHDYNNLVNIPWKDCTSTTRPASPYLGMKIYETDLKCLRIWDQFPGDSAPAWRVMLGATTPVVRIRQSIAQTLNPAGSILEWHEELEDRFGYFNAGTSLTNIVIKDAGLYNVSTAIQWDGGRAPDIATAVLCINGVETTVRESRFLRGNLFTPGFSQTLSVHGMLRFTANDVLTVKVKYHAPGLITWFLSFFDGPEKTNSRLDAVFISP